MSSAGYSLRALMGRIGIALVLCVALVAAGVVWVNRYIDDEIERIPRVALTTSTTTNNGTNFLIIGSDSRAFVDNSIDQSAFGSEAEEGGQRSDTLMVLHANGDKSFAVSFPRDTWVTLPNGSDAKINAAFNDGPQNVVDTLQQNFGVAVNHYLEVNFETFGDLVNAIGGVPVYSPYPMIDSFTGLNIGFPFACNVLDGGQALAYVRSRHPEEFRNGRWQDVSGIPDLDRIARQQEFVKTLGRVAMERALDDPTIAPDLADQVLPNLTADAGFDRAAFDELARALLGLRGGDSGVEFATLPTEGAVRGGGQQVLLLDKAAADPMLERLRGNVVVAPTPDTAAADGSATTAPAGPRLSDVQVTVRNGSGKSGAAGSALQELANVGFVPGQALNDSRGVVDRTEVRYRSSDAAKAQLVASYVEGADLVVDDSLSGAVVVVVGKNFKAIAKVQTPAADAPAATQTTLSPEAACTG
ncbi:MAG TPA: LCP family protein [Acidimicrobiia bacterium]|nr:LCP family protein [Acidimicrobiia bacterium]